MPSEHNKPVIDQAGKTLSIVLPAYNEAAIIGTIVQRLRDLYPEADLVVVDDNSQDDTAKNANEAGARVVRHHYNMGNGAAIKTGARNARGEIIVPLLVAHDRDLDPQPLGRLEDRDLLACLEFFLVNLEFFSVYRQFHRSMTSIASTGQTW